MAVVESFSPTRTTPSLQPVTTSDDFLLLPTRTLVTPWSFDAGQAVSLDYDEPSVILDG